MPVFHIFKNKNKNGKFFFFKKNNSKTKQMETNEPVYSKCTLLTTLKGKRKKKIIQVPIIIDSISLGWSGV